MAKLEYSVWTIEQLQYIRVSAFSNFGANAQTRFYLDGSSPGSWQNMLTDPDGYKYYQQSGLAIGTYVVEYKDDLNGELTLSKVNIVDKADTCYSEGTGYTFIYVVQPTKLRVIFDAGGIIGQTIPAAQAAFAKEASVDGGLTWRDVVYQSGSTTGVVEWTNTELATLGVLPVIENVLIRRKSNACTESYGIDINTLEEVTFPALNVSGSHTNVTAPGANDGTITLVVTGGSGNYSFEWADGPTVQNRAGLTEGIYSCTVTDDVTDESEEISFQILGPDAPPTGIGTIFEVPMMNSLHYVVDPIVPDHETNLQTPDNTLFADQYFPGFKKGKYYQKIIKAEKPITQFYTDYPIMIAALFDKCTDDVVKTFPIILKEENIGATETFPINIRNYAGNPGKSRVLFNEGTPPIPVAVGDSFGITDNGNGFNGSYIIQDIVYDDNLGYPFLVINLNYTAPGTSASANGTFAANTVDFNVYEFEKDFSDVADGEYYVKITVSDNIGQRVAFSEPIDLKLSHPKTNLIEYWNTDNAFDITWTTGYKGRIRVESLLFKRIPGGERSVSRDSDFSLRKLSAKKQRIFQFQTFFLPPYLHEKLAVLFDCDEVRINGVPFQSSDGYGQPEYLDRFMLANSSINVEQVGWFDKYNSTDIGSSVNENFLQAEDDDSLIKI